MTAATGAATGAATAAAEAAATSAAETVRAAGRPDHGAAGARLSELFDRHGATVLGLCRLMLRHREEAEDAVQQTFLAAYRGLLNGTDPRHPAAWLATIARNECRGRIEQRMREPLGERESESTLPDPVAAAAAKADLAELWQAIGALPRQQREVLLLREFSGLSYAELAGALEISEPAVESLLFRARRELRLRLKLVYGSVGAVAPLVAIREALARAIGGMPDPSTSGAVAKVLSAPLVAKLAAGAATIVVAGGTVAAVQSHSIRRVTSSVSKWAAKSVTASAPRTAAASASRVVASVRPTPRPSLAVRAPSVRVPSPHRSPARAASTPATASVQPEPREAAAPSVAADPAASAPGPPSVPASSPGSASAPDGQSSPAGGGSNDSAAGAGRDGSGSPPQSVVATSSSSGDTTGTPSSSSGLGDSAASSDNGNGSGTGDSPSSAVQGSGHDGGGDGGGVSGSGD